MVERDDEWQWPDDEEPSQDELAEAEALARALDRGVASSVSEEALEAAALLRVSQQPELKKERSQQLWSELEAGAKFSDSAASRDSKQPWLWVLLPMLAGAAALLVVLDVGESGSDAPPLAAAPIPEPPTALLEAQADYMNSDETETREAFEQHMGEYRNAVLASLEEHYR